MRSLYTKLAKAWGASPTRVDERAGLIFRKKSDFTSEELLNGVSLGRRIEVARTREATYRRRARGEDGLLLLLADTYLGIAERLEMEQRGAVAQERAPDRAATAAKPEVDGEIPSRPTNDTERV